jgi:hypothetical protein
MTTPDLTITGDPGRVWHVGFEPDPWAWAPWKYATDEGRFDGRWDDQAAAFRTLYTSDSLEGCLLELLARFRPSNVVLEALAAVVDDDGTGTTYPDAPARRIGHRWLEGRRYGNANLVGRYCFVTHSRSIGVLQTTFPFARHGIAARDVDTALLKDSYDRNLTRSIARWLYELSDDNGPLVDGIEFRSRHGDEIHLWAVFERPDDGDRSRHLHPAPDERPLTDDVPELIAALAHFDLAWVD